MAAPVEEKSTNDECRLGESLDLDGTKVEDIVSEDVTIEDKIPETQDAHLQPIDDIMHNAEIETRNNLECPSEAGGEECLVLEVQGCTTMEAKAQVPAWRNVTSLHTEFTILLGKIAASPSSVETSEDIANLVQEFSDSVRGFHLWLAMAQDELTDGGLAGENVHEVDKQLVRMQAILQEGADRLDALSAAGGRLQAVADPGLASQLSQLLEHEGDELHELERNCQASLKATVVRVEQVKRFGDRVVAFEAWLAHAEKQLAECQQRADLVRLGEAENLRLAMEELCQDVDKHWPDLEEMSPEDEPQAAACQLRIRTNVLRHLTHQSRTRLSNLCPLATHFTKTRCDFYTFLEKQQCSLSDVDIIVGSRKELEERLKCSTMLVKQRAEGDDLLEATVGAGITTLEACGKQSRQELQNELHCLKSAWDEIATSALHCHSRLEWLLLHWQSYSERRDQILTFLTTQREQLTSLTEPQPNLQAKLEQLERCQSLLLGINSASKPLAWLIDKARELHDATEDASLQEDADGKLGEALHLTEAQYEERLEELKMAVDVHQRYEEAAKRMVTLTEEAHLGLLAQPKAEKLWLEELSEELQKVKAVGDKTLDEAGKLAERTCSHMAPEGQWELQAEVLGLQQAWLALWGSQNKESGGEAGESEVDETTVSWERFLDSLKHTATEKDAIVERVAACEQLDGDADVLQAWKMSKELESSLKSLTMELNGLKVQLQNLRTHDGPEIGKASQSLIILVADHLRLNRRVTLLRKEQETRLMALYKDSLRSFRLCLTDDHHPNMSDGEMLAASKSQLAQVCERGESYCATLTPEAAARVMAEISACHGDLENWKYKSLRSWACTEQDVMLECDAVSAYGVLDVDRGEGHMEENPEQRKEDVPERISSGSNNEVFHSDWSISAGAGSTAWQEGLGHDEGPDLQWSKRVERDQRTIKMLEIWLDQAEPALAESLCKQSDLSGKALAQQNIQVLWAEVVERGPAMARLLDGVQDHNDKGFMQHVHTLARRYQTLHHSLEDALPFTQRAAQDHRLFERSVNAFQQWLVNSRQRLQSLLSPSQSVRTFGAWEHELETLRALRGEKERQLLGLWTKGQVVEDSSDAEGAARVRRWLQDLQADWDAHWEVFALCQRHCSGLGRHGEMSQRITTKVNSRLLDIKLDSKEERIQAESQTLLAAEQGNVLLQRKERIQAESQTLLAAEQGNVLRQRKPEVSIVEPTNDSKQNRCCAYCCRVLRAAIPFLFLLLLLLCLMLLYWIPGIGNSHTCSLANNFARSFQLMLTYTNGPPPT
uniref:nesprin-3 isoform X2 n=1 Tax=Myxine glutinosa TaxID=7769 RepID=UPI00358F4908